MELTLKRSEKFIISKPLKREIRVKELNDTQLSLLRMFARPMTEEQTLNLKRLIVNYLSEELDKEVERVVAEKGITDADYEKLRNEHQRTPKK